MLASRLLGLFLALRVPRGRSLGTLGSGTYRGKGEQQRCLPGSVALREAHLSSAALGQW